MKDPKNINILSALLIMMKKEFVININMTIIDLCVEKHKHHHGLMFPAC